MLQSSGLECYIQRLVHEFLNDDTDRRLQFYELFLNECHYSFNIVMKILWSDEVNFTLSGHDSRYNCIYFGCYWSSHYHRNCLEPTWSILCVVLFPCVIPCILSCLKEMQLVSPTCKCCKSICTCLTVTCWQLQRLVLARWSTFTICKYCFFERYFSKQNVWKEGFHRVATTFCRSDTIGFFL